MIDIAIQNLEVSFTKIQGIYFKAKLAWIGISLTGLRASSKFASSQPGNFGKILVAYNGVLTGVFILFITEPNSLFAAKSGFL